MAYVGDADRRRRALTFDMFADTLLRAEQLHLLRVMAWGAASVIAGTALFALLVVRRVRSPLLRVFGAVCLVLGGIEILCGAISYRAVRPRAFDAAVRLDRALWFELGFLAAAALAGIAGAVLGSRPVRRAGIVGGSVALTVHALAIALLDVQFASILSR